MVRKWGKLRDITSTILCDRNTVSLSSEQFSATFLCPISPNVSVILDPVALCGLTQDITLCRVCKWRQLCRACKARRTSHNYWIDDYMSHSYCISRRVGVYGSFMPPFITWPWAPSLTRWVGPQRRPFFKSNNLRRKIAENGSWVGLDMGRQIYIVYKWINLDWTIYNPNPNSIQSTYLTGLWTPHVHVHVACMYAIYNIWEESIYVLALIGHLHV